MENKLENPCTGCLYQVDDTNFNKTYYRKTATRIFPEKAKEKRSWRKNPDLPEHPDTGCTFATGHLRKQSHCVSNCPFKQCVYDWNTEPETKIKLLNWLAIPEAI